MGALGALLAAALPRDLAVAGAADLYLRNPLTGVAIDGYDPVGYFTDSAAQRGVPDFEYVWDGVPWYFVSEANRDVFMRAPEIYAPRFGGRCATALSRGYLSDGDPRIFAVYRGGLSLFYSIGNREAFLLAPAETLAAAEARWPELAGRL